MKRFYADVTVTPGLGIALDRRPVRTPAKVELKLPTIALADAVAEEWRQQDVEIKPHTMPLTGLSNAAIDHVMPDPEAFAAGLAVYAETDVLCYRANDPPPLCARQDALWNPVLAWAARRYAVRFNTVTGIMHTPQPPETVRRLAAALASYDPFVLAALNPLITISGSLVIALAVVEAELTAEAAFDAAHLDELWQAEQWGEDDFALEARALHRRDFLSAARFVALLDPDNNNSEGVHLS